MINYHGATHRKTNMMVPCIKSHGLGIYTVVVCNSQTAEEIVLNRPDGHIAYFKTIEDANVACRMAECYGVNPETGQLKDERKIH